jgi:UDPglucose 6-dehydrogenase
MNIAIIGDGYVGLTTAICLATSGHLTYCVGLLQERIDKIRRGNPLIHEENLEQMLKDVLARKRFRPTIDLEKAVLDSDLSFICVGTPSKTDGSIDLSQIRDASEKIGQALSKKSNYSVIVVRSTVIPGTTDQLVIPTLEQFSGKRVGRDFGVCMNPEFLREGQAVINILSPKDIGIVIGEYDEKSGNPLVGLYTAFEAEIMRTSIRTAEMIKYARNSYLAKDISFANEVANICQKCGADYLSVKKGMEMDARIGKGRFLDAGAGFGGSCFPKDIRALATKASEIGVNPEMLRATLRVNDLQPYKLIELARRTVGRLKGKRIAVLGLAFKPGTDDMREAVSIKIVNSLIEQGATVCVHDPRALNNAKAIFGDKIDYASHAEQALRSADACIIVTEWPEYANGELYQHLRAKFIIDGRRVLDPRDLPSGFTYHAIGLSGQVKT